MRILQLSLYTIIALVTFAGCEEKIEDRLNTVDFFFDHNDLTTHYSISSLAFLDTSTILFSGLDHQIDCNIYTLNIDTKKISSVAQAEFINIDSTIEELYYSENYRIWKGKDILLRYNDQSLTSSRWRVRYLWSVSDLRSTASAQMKIDQEGNVWVAEHPESGLRMFDGQEWHTYFEEDVFMYVSIDRNDNIYASTLPKSEEQGILLRYDHTNWDTLYTCNEYNHWVTGVDFDDNGDIWFGILSRSHVGISYGGGLIKYDGEGFEEFTTYNSNIPGNSVIDIFINPGNDIWVGTYNAGFAKFTSNQIWENFSDIDLINYNIENILESIDGQLYFTIKSFGLGKMKL